MLELCRDVASFPMTPFIRGDPQASVYRRGVHYGSQCRNTSNVSFVNRHRLRYLRQRHRACQKRSGPKLRQESTTGRLHIGVHLCLV